MCTDVMDNRYFVFRLVLQYSSVIQLLTRLEVDDLHL